MPGATTDSKSLSLPGSTNTFVGRSESGYDTWCPLVRSRRCHANVPAVSARSSSPT